MKKRKIFGVMAAEASSIEQRQILDGIITAAQTQNIDIAVFTNIFNLFETDINFSAENRVYELALSPELDGLILIAESFLNTKLKEDVLSLLRQRNDIPLVVISMYAPEFDFPNGVFVNSSDAADIADIVSHMTEVHGYRNIDILTGFEGNPAAEDRVEGFRTALKAHGIEFDPARVHYGDFWMSSGEELAKKYIRKELPLPEAVICTNDYMAFGLLDELARSDIRVPEDLAVAGYENVQERIYHTPTLATYQRNRFALGEQAVQILLKPQTKCVQPKGEWVTGVSCGCHVSQMNITEELEKIRTQRAFRVWSSTSNMEMKLTTCETLEEFITEMSAHLFVVRYACDILLCLYEKWHTGEQCGINERMAFRSIASWRQDEPTRYCYPFQLSGLMCGDPCAYYFTPVFFRDRLLGFSVLRYDHPDCFDITYRDWVKGVSNGLEFLRMKNDIQYLMRCQSLSEDYDSVTGLIRRKALLREISAVIARAEQKDSLFLMVLRGNQLAAEFHLQNENEKIRMSKAITGCLQAIEEQGRSFSALLEGNTFLFAGVGQYSDESRQQLVDLLRIYLLYSSECFTETAPDSFQITTAWYPLNRIQPDKCIDEVCEKAMQEPVQQYTADDLQMLKLRIRLYHSLSEQPTAEECCRQLCFSEGYFRARYKKLFGISYHQDCIQARISYAKYLLLTTSLSVSAIAAQCGYHEDNYFLRQFQRETGTTPNKYRKKLV